MARILLLIKALGYGGAEQLLVHALRYRDRSRFDYEVAYALGGNDALADHIRGLDVPVHCLSADRGGRWMNRLAKLVREQSIDLVHVHSPHMAIGARLRFPRRLHPPLVYTEHNVWQSYRRATRWGNLLTYPRNDFVLAVSDHVRASVRYPAPLAWRRRPPLETLFHGIDLAAVAAVPRADDVRLELGIAEGAPVIGCVANFRGDKDHSTLLAVTELVLRRVPDLRLVLVGAGPLELSVRREVRERGLDPVVIFTGSRSDVLRLVGCFDVFTLSSVHEGLSIALVEAMALGKPPVVTSVGGMPEVVVDGAGLVVPPRSPQMMAEAIVRLIADPELRCEMGDAARRRAADFDIRRTVSRIEGIYTELLA